MKKRFANTVNHGKNEYQQKRVDNELFNGYVSLVKIINVEHPWIVSDDEETRCILDENYHWLEIYPDNKNYAITAMFNTENKVVEWYFDMTKYNGIEDGIPYIMDLYLDLVFKSNGKWIVLDEDELQDALETNDITKEDFDLAYKTMNEIIELYGKNFNLLQNLTRTLYAEFDK